MYEKTTHTIVWKKNHAYKGMGKKDAYKCMKKKTAYNSMEKTPHTNV